MTKEQSQNSGYKADLVIRTETGMRFSKYIH